MTTKQLHEILAMACPVKTEPEPQQWVYPAALAGGPVFPNTLAGGPVFPNTLAGEPVFHNTSLPCYCNECLDKVTHRDDCDMPGITRAPHDKSFLDMQFGPDHAKRLTAKQYCDAITAWCRNTDPTQSKRLWAAFHETEASVQ